MAYTQNDVSKDIIYIYGLMCPIINKIRYIGKSISPQERLDQHLKDKRELRTHKGRWMKVLIAQGKKPNIVILEEVYDGNWEEREIYWIGKHRQEGDYLTNATIGGEGLKHGYKHSQATKDKISAALYKRDKSIYLQNGPKISKSLTGKKLSLSARMSMSKYHKQNWINLPLEEKEKRINRLHYRGSKRKNSTSKYRGVSWFNRKSSGCWRAWLVMPAKETKQKIKHLGYFINEVKAAKAYNKAAMEYFGESAILNTFDV